ncbi:zinc finger protein 511 isoform X3 [Castor canadensis]|uniref:Zinc finger protein 511 isoform X3 n=1 Tax=Castor canadensis TaxID=51338 RepID=A0AC58MXJ5_CASCN
MLLPPAVSARLAGAPGTAEPLPVERDPAAGAPPFRFAARPVRFPRDHEFFEDGDVQRHLYLQDVLTQVAEAPERSRVPEFTCHVAGCCQVFAALEDYQHHYHVMHGNACSLCSRAFPSSHLLEAHILEWHDSLFQILAERQDMYQCLVVGCPEKFKTSQDRKDHMLCQELRQACQPEPRRMMGTPWKSARNPLCRLPVGGPTATGFLLPSALARVHLEGFKAPRRETNTADGYGKRTRTRCLGRQVGDRTLWVIVSTGAFLLLLL